eukprot:751177-Prymnesium_polylepis.1
MLFDFGLASIWKVNPSAADGGGDDETRPLSGETGSLRYMAPEVALCQPYNHKADIFSFASVFYEMCAHEKPFASVDSDQFKKTISEGLRPPIRTHWPAALQRIFSDCWRASPADRPDAREIEPRLEALLSDPELALTEAAKPQPSRACTIS